MTEIVTGCWARTGAPTPPITTATASSGIMASHHFVVGRRCMRDPPRPGPPGPVRNRTRFTESPELRAARRSRSRPTERRRRRLPFEADGWLQARHHAVGEVLDHPILSIQRRVEHDLAQALLLQALDALRELLGSAREARRPDEIRGDEPRLLRIDE